MPRPKPRVLIENLLLGLAFVSLLVGVWALVFPDEVTRENRALLIIAGSLGLFTSLIGFVLALFTLRFLRKRTSEKVLSVWQKSIAAGSPAQIDSAHQLSEGALRILAMQLFTRIGYNILNRDKDEGHVRMLNPQGQLELVACRQQELPLEIQPVYEFQQDLKRDGAVKGHFWAAGGFTAAAAEWASQKPIQLADRQGIGQFIDSVLANRSRLIE
jgi:hypothetical protein